MKKHICLIFICLALLQFTKCEDEPINKYFDTYEPIFMAELWRHGARAAAKNSFD
jgi:hypothetical protein